MPQMYPLNWTMIFLLWSFSMITLTSYIFFSETININHKYKPMSMKKNKMMW